MHIPRCDRADVLEHDIQEANEVGVAVQNHFTWYREDVEGDVPLTQLGCIHLAGQCPTCVALQRFFERDVQIENVVRTQVGRDETAKHGSVVLGNQDALDDDVVPEGKAVLRRLLNERDVVPMWDVVFTQDDSPEVVLTDIRGATPHR